jgi:hypothetical protein
MWPVRIRLQAAYWVRDLALFDLEFDSKLRGCDLIKLRIGYVTIGRTIRAITARAPGFTALHSSPKRRHKDHNHLYYWPAVAN